MIRGVKLNDKKIANKKLGTKKNVNIRKVSLYLIFFLSSRISLHLGILHTPTNNIIFHFVFFHFKSSNIVMSSSILICISFFVHPMLFKIYTRTVAGKLDKKNDECRRMLLMSEHKEK